MNDSNEMIPQPSYPAVACFGLTKAYPGTFALNGIDLELPRGQIIGLLGPNGSGKTTLIKILAGLLTPTSGTVLLDGLAPGTDTRSFVSYLPDRSYFNPSMRVCDCVEMFREFYADFDAPRAIYMIDMLGVPYKAKLKTLSKGTLEKIRFLLVMSRRAKLYLLDEPIGGVDPTAREFILNTLLVNRTPDSTVVLSTHLIRDVEEILDGFVMIGNGTVLASGNAEEARMRHGMCLDGLFREVFR